MQGLQIKVNGAWIHLPSDFSISLEQASPVFNKEGIFSFPFEIPLAPNRSIFKNITSPFGDISLNEIDNSSAEVWFNGVMLYRGVIEVDEEVEIEESIPVTFLSGNSDFLSRIEEMNCRDVPLDREIKLGYRVDSVTKTFEDQGHEVFLMAGFGNSLMNYEANVSNPYPIKPYCNARICTPGDMGGYNVLEAKRPNSGVCFYVLYLIDCLFKHLQIAGNTEKLQEVEDLCRLAFFTTQCHTKDVGEVFLVEWSDIANKDFIGPTFKISMTYDRHSGNITNLTWTHKSFDEKDFMYKAVNVYATNNNFPDVSVKEVIEDLENVFGIIFLYDSTTNTIKTEYKKNIFKQSEIKVLNVEILNYVIVKSKYRGVKLTYGNDDDTAFNYNDWSNVVQEPGYKEILNHGVASYDTACYYDKKTGNAYRVKVDKDTGGNPALMEVAGFRDYVIGDGGDKEKQEISINFSPVIVNDVNGREVVNAALSGEEKQQTLAVFVGETLLSDKKLHKDIVPYLVMPVDWYSSARTKFSLTYETSENFDTENAEESPLRTYDAGYTLGVMRGPGNKSGVEYKENYDGEGNSSWMQTVANYAFTADSCDNFGRYYDYNGLEPGGADQEGRFSLKLIAGKEDFPIDSNYRDRGLVSKFLSEYLYFMANKKTVILTVRMNITQIVGIDFLKRYEIGNFVGYINKVSYTLDVNGTVESTIELYTL